MAASKALVVAFQTVFDFLLQFPAAWHSATRDLKCLIPESYAIAQRPISSLLSARIHK